MRTLHVEIKEMVSSKTRGNNFENEVKKDMENKGFLVFKAQRTAKFIGPGRIISMANDFFGLFDLICKKGQITYWIQCKYGKDNIYSKRKEMEDFANNYSSRSELIIIATKEPRKQIEYIIYHKDEKKWAK